MRYVKETDNEKKKVLLIDQIKIFIIVFIVGGLAGYIYEEVFYYFQDGFLTNRGVLFGPFLPAYAVGALLMALLLNKFKKHPIVIFIFSMLITGVVEYVTGYYLLNVSGERLWDYTGLFLNIDGIVCLRSVLSFAVGGIILIYWVLPLIRKLVLSKHRWVSNMIIIVFFIFFILDIVLVNIYR